LCSSFVLKVVLMNGSCRKQFRSRQENPCAGRITWWMRSRAEPCPCDGSVLLEA
jgi:hypothetical protein